jgi:Ser/Thr protein kinase RdoA (MazF antagonist)
MSVPSETSFAEQKLVLPVVEQYRKRLGTLLSAEILNGQAYAGHTYKIETEKGLWLVKDQGSSTVENHIDAEQEICLALMHNGLNLTVPYVFDDDEQPYVKWKNHYWTVNRYIDNEPRYDWTRPSWPKSICAKAAAGLAQFHLAGYRILRRSASITSEFKQIQLSTFADRFDEAIQQSEAGIEMPESSLAEFKESTSWLRDEVATTVKLLEDLGQNEQTPPTVVHGDYHAGNTLFFGDHLVAIVDLHYVHLGNPVYDLAYGTVMFGTDWLAVSSGADGNDISPAIPESQAAFVMSYRKALRSFANEPGWTAAINDSDLLTNYMKLACFLIMHWALEPTSSSEELQTRNRVYLNALRLLRHLNVP